MTSWDEAMASLTAAYGLRTWGTKLGHGSFLTLELGEPTPADPTHGAYHLWVYLTAWRIDGDTMLAASEDDRATLAERVRVLDERTLTGVEVDPVSLSARFIFSGGLTLSTFSIYTGEDEHWMLWRPDRMVLTAGPGNTWTLEPASG